MRSSTYAVLLATLGCSCAWGDDWPQWLGPQRDSVWREKGIVQQLPAGGLTPKWRAPIAGGYAGPAVAGGKVYVTDYQRESGDPTNGPSRRAELTGKERVHCLNADSGAVEWTYAYPCSYRVSYPAGPRATPTVAGGKVYVLGAMGNLSCLDAQTGKPVWSVDLQAAYKTEAPIWGFAGHPLVDGQKLICLVGGQNSVAVAFDKNTGKVLWTALSAGEPGYAPPTIVETGGQRQLVLWHAEAVNGLDPETGNVYWSVPLAAKYGMSIATPRQLGEHLFVSGIGNAALLLKLHGDSPQADVVWGGDSRRGVYCANSTPFLEGDTIFGVCHEGELRGIDLLTGKRLWETYAATTGKRVAYGTAFLVKHEERFFLLNDAGDLIIARLDREGYHEQCRAHLLDPTNEAFGRPVVWSHPAFANRCVYARNDKEIICVSLHTGDTPN